MRRLTSVVVALAVLAIAPVSAQAARCSYHSKPTRIVDTPAPAELLANLEVLRRPQTDAERAILDTFGGSWFGTILGPSVRFLGTGPEGASYYLVPGTQSIPVLPRRCLRGLSPKQRRLEQRRRRAARRSARQVRLSTFAFDANGGGGGGGSADLRALLNNRTLLTIGQRDGSSVASALVPDGVATVELTFEGLEHRTVTASSNFWTARVPLSPPRAFPILTVWKAADGTVVERFREDRGL